jgi:hypothetical protein
MVLAQHNCGGCQLVKGATALCTCRKECNKYDLTATQCFWLAHHNDWLRWFAISSPPPICCLSFGFMGGVAKEYISKLGCEKHFRKGCIPSIAGDVLRSNQGFRWILLLFIFSYFICFLNWCLTGFIYSFILISIWSFRYCSLAFFFVVPFLLFVLSFMGWWKRSWRHLCSLALIHVWQLGDITRGAHN